MSVANSYLSPAIHSPLAQAWILPGVCNQKLEYNQYSIKWACTVNYPFGSTAMILLYDEYDIYQHHSSKKLLFSCWFMHLSAQTALVHQRFDALASLKRWMRTWMKGMKKRGLQKRSTRERMLYFCYVRPWSLAAGFLSLIVNQKVYDTDSVWSIDHQKNHEPLCPEPHSLSHYLVVLRCWAGSDSFVHLQFLLECVSRLSAQNKYNIWA